VIYASQSGFRHWEGRATPVVATLSPVARDYPSRAFSDVFQAAAHSTVLSRNEADSATAERSLKLLFSTSSSPAKVVNNLGIIWLTGYSHRGARPRCEGLEFGVLGFELGIRFRIHAWLRTQDEVYAVLFPRSAAARWSHGT